MSRIAQTVVALLAITAAALAGYAGYRLVRSELAAEIYRKRAEQLDKDYRQLQGRYNEAVQKLAVTVLDVEDGRLTMTVLGGDGREQRIPTEVDPDDPVYVDFVVIDGRLMIRRVYNLQEVVEPGDPATRSTDRLTLVGRGTTLDPTWLAIDWDRFKDAQGKVVYRPLGEDGRWVVKVTGNGAMELAPLAPGEQVTLVNAPEIRDYRPVEQEIDTARGKIGPVDVVKELFGVD